MLVLTMFCFQFGNAQGTNSFNTISLNNLDAFKDPGNNWVIAADAIADMNKEQQMKPAKGQGVIVNDFAKKGRTHLVTKEEFGDIELDLDFMMAKNSNSGVYLQGRYEIQLFDSWTKLNPVSSDVGAVYSRWTAEKGTFEGTPPVMNVARAPGLWQHLNIRFRAPRFNEKGEKIENARFESVRLNGVLVQQEVEVTGSTASHMFEGEQTKGPLVLQGDHGPVAFKNIRYRPLVEESLGPKDHDSWIPGSKFWNTVDPIIVEAGSKPSFIKTFLMHGGKKLTHVLSVGNPSEVNYSYDVKQGALFQVWRGKFLDVTPAWRDRGGLQLGIPFGSVISLSDAPAVAKLQNENTAWPDSAAFDELNNRGYSLNNKRSPTFKYILNDIKVADSITALDNGGGLSRTLTIENPSEDIYIRLAVSNKIENIGADLFAVGGKSYYISVDKKYKPLVRTSGSQQEIIIKYTGPVTYSLIW
jgi:hypothetical protein